MRNLIQKGETINFAAPAGGVASGDFALVGALYGVAVTALAATVSGPFVTRGLFALPKAAGAAWSQGDQLYWDNVAKNFTKTAGGNTAIGAAGEAAQAADVVGTVFLR